MFRLLIALALFALTAPQTHAQLVPERGAEPSTAPTADPFGRETPRGAVTGLLDALAAQDYARAGNFMPLTDEDNEDATQQSAQLARQLQAALDAGGSLGAFGALSNESGGRVDDGLPPDIEQVGSLAGEEGAPILLVRSEAADGMSVWRISSETTNELESEVAAVGTDNPETKGSVTISGAPLRDWGLLLGIATGSFLLFWLIASAILAAMRSVVADREQNVVFCLAHAALPPLSLFLAVVGFQIWAGSVEASIIARQTMLRYIGIVAWVAFVWFALRLVDAISRVITGRMERRERRQAISVIVLMRRAAKVALMAFAFVAILDTLGVDVTTGIAALGIGGLALALGAQKTVENLVGSISVIADKPVQVGDFCRVGDVSGTVEDIGMRSTRLRTTQRTIVTIPNADFSSQQIENFSVRDRFLFNPIIRIEYGISSAKLREGVEIIERVLMEHDKVESDSARARLTNLGASSLDIEIFSYILESDFTESLVVQQQLLLTIIERLEAAGLSIAFPMQKLYVVGEGA